MAVENLGALISVLSNEPSKLNGTTIDEAVKAGYLDRTYKYNIPDCEECGNKLEFSEDSESGKVYICTLQHQKTFTQKELDKLSTIHLQTGVVIESFIDKVFDAKRIKEKEPLEEVDVTSYGIKLDDGWSFNATFLIDKEPDMAELGYLALRASKQRTPWICFYNSVFFSSKKDEFYELLSSVPLGMYVLSININDWFKGGAETKGIKEFNEELQTYRNLYGKIKSDEDKLLEGIEAKNLVYNIDTNPKLILTLAMRFRFDRSSLNWQDFQNLAKVSFSIMYHSDLNVGGRLFKPEPDFIFKYVEETTSTPNVDARRTIVHFFGIGDSKFLEKGKNLKLSDELTEKYQSYFLSMRKNGIAEANKVVELIVFYNSDFSLKAEEFVDRLYNSGKLDASKDIVVFLDTWAFLPLMTKYLSMIERSTKYTGKENKTDNSSIKPEDLLHPDTLKKNFVKTTTKGNNYYLVDTSAVDKLYSSVSKKKSG